MERKIGGGGKGEGRGKEEEDEGNLKEKKEANFSLIWPFGSWLYMSVTEHCTHTHPFGIVHNYWLKC